MTATLSTPSSSTRKRDIEAALVRNVARALSEQGRTKRSAVRLAISRAVSDGALKPGDFLPPEKRLAEILGVSLGTVQAALQQLQLRGEIVRRSGYGSRVISTDQFANSVWHFRFVDKADGQRLIFSDQHIAIDTVKGAGIWSAFLGETATCCRIMRQMQLSNGARVMAFMYLHDALAPRLKDVEPGELSAVNIRTYLQDEFDVVTARAENVVLSAKADAAVAGQLDLSVGADILELQAKAYTHDEAPVYFQRILAPADRCALAF